MRVMPSGSEVADKAVSTEDATGGVEVARLEAVLAALVETKVEAIKASTSAGQQRSGSAPASPRRPRLTSSSTGSSSQNNHHGHHHGHHHHTHRHRQERKARHHRRHGSAPCGDYIEDPVTHRHKQRHGKGKQKLSESPRAGRKRRRQSRSPQTLRHSRALDSRFELLDGAELTGEPASGSDLAAFLNLERMREALSDVAVSGGVGDYPGLHQSACYISHSTAQLKSHYGEEDYLSFTFADDCEEDESFSGGLGVGHTHTLPPRSSRSTRDHRFHRPRKKRKQHRKQRQRARQQLVDDVELELAVDPDDLPPRARWTIVATACLLLAMSLLLVGVTLRMAPIIDEMDEARNLQRKCIQEIFGRSK